MRKGKERERERQQRQKEEGAERVEAECISPHYTDYVPLANISRCIDAHTLAKIRQKGCRPYRDVSEFFAVSRKK